MTKMASKINNGSVDEPETQDFRARLVFIINDFASLRPQRADPSILTIFNKINFVWNFAIKRLQEFNSAHFIKNAQVEALTAALLLLKSDVEALKNQISSSLIPATGSIHANQSLMITFEEMTWGIINAWFDDLIRPLIAMQEAVSISEVAERVEVVPDSEIQVDDHVVELERPKPISRFVKLINEWHDLQDSTQPSFKIPLSFFVDEHSYQALLECIPLFEPRQVFSIMRALCLKPQIESGIIQKAKREIITLLVARCSQKQRNELISALIVNSQTSNIEIKISAYINLQPLSDYYPKEHLDTVVQHLLKDCFSENACLREAAHDLLISLKANYRKEHFSKVISELEKKSHSREIYTREAARKNILNFAPYYGLDQINQLINEYLSDNLNYTDHFISSFISKCTANYQDAIIKKLNSACYSSDVKMRLLAYVGFCAAIKRTTVTQRTQFINMLIEDCQHENEEISKKAKEIFINLAKYGDELHVNKMIEIFKNDYKSASSSERQDAALLFVKLILFTNTEQQNNIISFLIEEYQNPHSVTRHGPWRALVAIASLCRHVQLEKIIPSLIHNYFRQMEWIIDELDWEAFANLSLQVPEEFVEYFPNLMISVRCGQYFVKNAAYKTLMNIAPYCSKEQMIMLIPVLIAARQHDNLEARSLALDTLPLILPYCSEDQKQQITDFLLNLCQDEALYEMAYKNLSLFISDCNILQAIQLMSSGKNTLLLNYPILSKHILWAIYHLVENESKPLSETLINYLFHFSCLQKVENVVDFLTSTSVSKVSMAVMSLLVLPVAASQRCIIDHCQSNPSWNCKIAVSAFERLSHIPLAESFADLISETMEKNISLEVSLS